MDLWCKFNKAMICHFKVSMHIFLSPSLTLYKQLTRHRILPPELWNHLKKFLLLSVFWGVAFLLFYGCKVKALFAIVVRSGLYAVTFPYLVWTEIFFNGKAAWMLKSSTRKINSPPISWQYHNFSVLKVTNNYLNVIIIITVVIMMIFILRLHLSHCIQY